MKKFVFYIFFIFFLVVYIYSIVFEAFPISTKIVLEGVGLIACTRKLLSTKFRLKQEYRVIINIILALVLWDLITSSFNGQTEFHLIKDMLPVLGSLFGAQLLYSIGKKRIKKTEGFLDLVVVTIFAESLLTVLMNLFPPIFSFVESFLLFDYGDDYITDIFDMVRFYGIGNARYFGVLPSCTLGVMTSVYLINKSDSYIVRMFFMITWAVISITSFFVARWTLAIVGLSMVLFILNQRGKSILKTIGLVFGLILVISVVYLITMNNLDSELEEWAFSFFQGSSSDDGSANRVLEWWTNTKFDFKTFIIGDALFMDPVFGYYKRVDVGFFREIFYGGIIGLGLIVFGHIMILAKIYKYNKERSFKLFLSSLMLGYLAAMAKGDTNMMTFFILYLVFYSDGIFETTRKDIMAV